MRVYEVRPRKDKRSVDLISDSLPFARLWYGGPNAISNAIGYAQHRSRSYFPKLMEPEKTFLCMDLSPWIQTQNR
jgi:hypothetical protein